MLVGKPERKRQLGRPRRSWEDNMRAHVMEIGREDADWTHVAHYRDQWQVMNTRVQQKAGNFLTELLLASEVGFCSMELVS